MRQSITVSELNAYVKDSLENNPMLKGIILIGEVSGFKKYPSGHSYFVLKDENASINAVWFAQYANRSFIPTNGMLVEALGSVSLYSKEGRYQFLVRQIKPAGTGALYIAFDKLKRKLEQEGLFSAERKKAIPLYPKCIGVVTSGRGAAVRDIINVCTRRFPFSDILIKSVSVQGVQSAQDIADGILEMNQYNRADVLIVGRGGGSQEDLWAFNTEIVARAIVSSHIPVISAVGHETDITIADFVADLRAPTPSAAAELAVPDQSDVLRMINQYKQRLSNKTEQRVQESITKLKQFESALLRMSPVNRIEKNKLLLREAMNKLQTELSTAIMEKEHRYEVVLERLKALSPVSTLARGYTLVLDEQNKIIKTSGSLLPERISIMWSDGERMVQIQNQERMEKKNELI